MFNEGKREGERGGNNPMRRNGIRPKVCNQLAVCTSQTSVPPPLPTYIEVCLYIEKNIYIYKYNMTAVSRANVGRSGDRHIS